MIEPSTLTTCDNNGCTCTTFKLCICEDYDMLIYECTSCGYIHTHYFGENK
jgi:hypothetical protein